MSVKVIAQTHPFKSDLIKFSCERKELCRIYESLETGLDISHARMLINDEIITDFSTIPPDGSTVYIKVVPAGGKSGGKVTGWIGAAITAVGAALLFVPGLQGVGVALIGSGVSMVMSGIALYNIEIPSVGDRETAKQNPSIRGSRNRENQWGSVPVLLGRHLIYPDQAAKPYTTVADNQQYLHQLFCVGYNDIDIELDSLKIGDTKLIELSATKDINQILAGTDSVVKMEIIKDGSASALYPTVCRELQVNRIVKKTLSDGTSGNIVLTTADRTTRIGVDILFPNGLGKYNDKGKVVFTSVYVYAEYKLTTEPDSSYTRLGYFGGWDGIAGKELETKRYQLTKAVPAGQYNVRLRRTTEDASDSNTIDTVYWSTLKSYTDERPLRQAWQESKCIIALKVKATDRLNGVIDQFNLIAQTNIKRYSGSGTGAAAWTKALTANPAAMFLYVLQGQINSDPVADSAIDWSALEEWHEWCNEHNYTCNAVVSQGITISQLLKQIGLTARAEFGKRNSLFTVIQDKARDVPVQLFSPRNTRNFSSTKAFADIPHALKMQFVSETAGWADDERIVYNETDGYGDGSGGTNPAVKRQDVKLWGVTSSDQAYTIGRYMYGCTHLRPEVYNFDIDIEYLLCTRGDRALLSHDVPLMGLYRGRIKSRILDPGDENFVTGFILDEIINMESGNSYSIKIIMSTGQIITRAVVFAAGESNEVMLQLPFDIAYSPDSGDHFAFGIIGQETVDIIITGIEPMENLTAKITAVDYAPAIFNVDDPGFVIPPYDPKITVGGIVDDGLTKITPVEQDLYNLVSQRPTYAEIVSGFTGGGSSEIPLAPVLTARSFIRSIALMWSHQPDIINLLKYELQVTDDTESGLWFALRTDGVDWKGELDGFTEIAAGEHWYFHANIPPAGTEEEPVSRQLYYRVRAITKKDDISEWSEIATAQAGLVDSPDISAGSITAGKLVAGLINALFAQFGNIEVLDDGQAFNIDEYHRLLISPYTIRWQTRPDDTSPWETRRMIGNEAADEILADIVRFRGLFPMDRDFDFSIGYVRPVGSLTYDFDGDLKDQNGENGLTEDEDVNYSAGKFWSSGGGAVIAGSEVEYAGKLSKTFSRNIANSWTFGFWMYHEGAPTQKIIYDWDNKTIPSTSLSFNNLSRIVFSEDTNYLICNYSESPYWKVYKNNHDDTFTEITGLPAASSSPQARPAISYDSKYIAIPVGLSPYINIYKNNFDDTFIKLTNVPALSGNARFCSFISNTHDLVIAASTTERRHMYKVDAEDDEAFYDDTANSFSGSLAVESFGCAVSPDAKYILFTHNASTTEVCTIFKRDVSGVYEKIIEYTMPYGVISAACCFSSDGRMFAVGMMNPSHTYQVEIFTIDEYDSVTSFDTIAIDNHIYSLSFSPNGYYLCVASAYYVAVYKRFKNEFDLLSVLMDNGSYVGLSCDFSNDNKYLIIGKTESPYFALYKSRESSNPWVLGDYPEVPRILTVGDNNGGDIGLYHTASGLRLAKEGSDNVTDAIALPAGQWNFVSIRNNANGTLTLRVGGVTKTLTATLSGAVNLNAIFMLFLENLTRMDDLLFAPFIVSDESLIEYYTSGLKWADAAAGDTFIGCSPGKKIRMLDEVVFEKGSSESNRPPIGIPTMWFSSVPDWALAFDDGSGPYAWEDYPELDNEDFKAMLTIWSNAGWMPAYNSISFYVPDLKGLFPRISGTNAIRSTVYAGGNLADYLAHQFENHQHYHRHLALSNNDDNAHSPYNEIQGTSADSTSAYRVPTTYDNTLPTSGNHGTETRPGSFSLRIIVRFE